MNQQVAYTPYHPRWHRQRISTYWWLERPSYFLFILRELSSLAVAWFVAWLLLLVRAVSGGAAA
jgi:fumarate reductase subunit C